MINAHVDNDLKTGYITPAGGNEFADLGFSPKQAKAMLEDAATYINSQAREGYQPAAAKAASMVPRALVSGSIITIECAVLSPT